MSSRSHFVWSRINVTRRERKSSRSFSIIAANSLSRPYLFNIAETISTSQETRSKLKILRCLLRYHNYPDRLRVSRDYGTPSSSSPDTRAIGRDRARTKKRGGLSRSHNPQAGYRATADSRARGGGQHRERIER
ncbi:hypothetical protein PUN28_002793 [Cardiocondyla obscurior]|uniref:Uncharacterized protein n=1 Tax=Cardiocondyla obscurior TaxID=286306 RepID=A0AAW2GW62_9HYME